MGKLALARMAPFGLALLVVQGAAAAPSFTALPTGVVWNALSGDGSTVVGTGEVVGPFSFRPVRWRAENPGVAEPYPLVPEDELSGAANAAPNDGTIVGGNMQIAVTQDQTIPTRCSSRSTCVPTSFSFGFVDYSGSVFDVSSDASHGVGESYFFGGDHFAATYWGPTGARTLMTPYLPEEVGAATFLSNGTAISGDGAVAAGWTLVPTADPFAPTTQAFIWTPTGGFALLGDLPGGGVESRAEDVSNDGSTIVGTAASSLGNEAFYWTTGSGMVGLGNLGGPFGSSANAVSGDGSIIVGGASAAAGSLAFIWDPVNGMRSLYDVLLVAGVPDLAGWTLTTARGVSDDGSTFFGVGINPGGLTRRWVAVIPEPGTALLLGLGIALLGLRRARNVV